MKPVRIGILGAAKIAPSAVIEPAASLDGVEVVCVGARSLNRARDFAAAHEIPLAVEGYNAIVTSTDIDLVYNALPISLHAEWTIKAAQAGKHVLVEKSFAMNEAEAKTMIAAGEASGVRVVEAFHHRYHPAFIEFLKLVQSGAIGELEEIDAEFSVAIPGRQGEIRHDASLGGGAMRDLGCYPLTWSLSLVDAPIDRIDVEASLTPTGVDETVDADIHFRSGVRARLKTSMAEDQHLVRRLRISGSKGTIDFENPLAPHDGSELKLNGAIVDHFDANSGTTYFHQLSALSEAIAGGQRLPTEGDTILRQQRALDMICAQF